MIEPLVFWIIIAAIGAIAAVIISRPAPQAAETAEEILDTAMGNGPGGNPPQNGYEVVNIRAANGSRVKVYRYPVAPAAPVQPNPVPQPPNQGLVQNFYINGVPVQPAPQNVGANILGP